MIPSDHFRLNRARFVEQSQHYPAVRHAYSQCSHVFSFQNITCATSAASYPYFGRIYYLAETVVKEKEPSLNEALQNLLSALNEMNKYFIISGVGACGRHFPHSVALLKKLRLNPNGR